MEVTDDIADRLFRVIKEINSNIAKDIYNENVVHRYIELMWQIDINDLYRKFEKGFYPELLVEYLKFDINEVTVPRVVTSYTGNNEEFSKFIFNLVVNGIFYSLPEELWNYDDAVDIFIERVAVDPRTVRSYIFDNQFLMRAVNNTLNSDKKMINGLEGARKKAQVATLIASTITDDTIFSAEKQIHDYMATHNL